MTTPTPDTAQLLPCPCGETPTTLLITAEHDKPKWAYCCGDCCNVWSIEYRNAYVSITSDEGITRAREAWNEATRGRIERSPAADAERQWQPIETAPNTPEEVLCFCEYDDEPSHHSIHSAWDIPKYQQVTAWMPLPSPPKATP